MNSDFEIEPSPSVSSADRIVDDMDEAFDDDEAEPTAAVSSDELMEPSPSVSSDERSDDNASDDEDEEPPAPSIGGGGGGMDIEVAPESSCADSRTDPRSDPNPSDADEKSFADVELKPEFDIVIDWKR